MMLGAITLNDDLLLDGLENAPPLVVNQRRTITGESVVQSALNIGGRTLTLVAARDNDSLYGYFTQSQIDAINLLRAIGGPVSMTHHRGTFTVMIVDSDFQPRLGVADPDSDAMYTGRLTMIEV